MSEKVDFVCKILDEMGCVYEPKGNRVELLCLYHIENHRSAVIYYEDLGYYCFACQKTSQLYQVYAHVTGASLDYAQSRCGGHRLYKFQRPDGEDQVQRIKVEKELLWRRWLRVHTKITDPKERLKFEDQVEQWLRGGRKDLQAWQEKIESLEEPS